MSYKDYTSVDINVDVKRGLTTGEAASRLAKYGPNALQLHQTTWFDIFIRQFHSSFVYLLVVAAILSLLLKEYLDGSMIVAIIAANCLLGFFQEYKSERTKRLLTKYVVRKASVIRDGQEVLVEASKLTVGDVVLLEPGDIVPADLRIVQESGLLLDESSLTGESLPVAKTARRLAGDVPMHQAANIAFAQTSVVFGEAVGVVIAVGSKTEMGVIHKLTNKAEEESSFQKQMDSFSKFILYMTLITIVVVFFIHVIYRRQILSLPDLAIFSIALAVGVIPEALPLVTTFALSEGALKLAKKKVVVKRLSAIEDLGSIEILCSDKTGTLTENRLKIGDTYSHDKNELQLFSLLASVFNKNLSDQVNSFENAIIQEVTATQLSYVKTAAHVICSLPFSPDRKRNSVLVDMENRRYLVIKGAPENILPHITNLKNTDMANIASWVVTQGFKGRRVIAVANKEFIGDSYSQTDEENNLSLVGFLAFEDPIKKTTADAIKKAEKLKVRLMVLTGDSAEVAGYVAYRVGITKDPKHVITGDEFDKLQPAEQIKAVVKYNVFARVNPEQKYNIIKLLQQKFEVGYMGDGINDAPALKAANVAVAVDTSSDIAKETADIILLEKDLHVIVSGIEEGRKTFVNTIKYIKTTLSSNFGNFYALALASLVVDYLPMLPIQVLLVNAFSDFPMVSVSTDSVEPDELKRPHAYDFKEIALLATVLGVTSTVFDFLFFSAFKQFGEGTLRTNWFMGSILTELALIYSIRTKRPFFKAKTWPSLPLALLTVVSIVATVGIPFTYFGVHVVGFTTPTMQNLITVFSIVGVYFLVTEMVKHFYYRAQKHL